MEIRPFVTDLVNDLLASRSAFSGLFIYGKASRFANIINRFNVFKKDLAEAKETAIDFFADMGEIVAKYNRIVESWPKRGENFDCVRQVIKVSSKDEERLEVSPLGGKTKYIFDQYVYAAWSKRLKTKESVIAGGVTFFRNYTGNALSKLQRYGRHDTVGVHSTFIKPLLFYYRVMRSVKNTEVTAGILSGIILGVNRLSKAVIAAGAFDFIDDIVRQFLSEIDKITFVLCQRNASCSLIYSSLHGLATMGGPRGWTEESIKDSLTDWVSGTRKFPYEENSYLTSLTDKWVSSWCSGVKSSDLSFSEFVTDPMRWATGGGAKKRVINLRGVEVEGRNKWFWALSCLEKGKDLYEESLKEGNDAQVALKEEVKTRCVITTPQSSYLRQCYILYRLGRPKFLKSTLSDPSLVNQLASTRKDHFICIDSSSFDHSVSKNWILSILTRIANNCSGELADIVREEIESIKSMGIVYNRERYPYENGLLSGWRMTSLLGSLLSALVCEHINKELGLNLPYIVQGDDIIMTCTKKIEASRILDCCDKFGIVTNKKKTTIGRFGEFLKYRYGYGRVQGYAARSIRSIFYANPWLDQTSVSVPSEVAGKWWMLASRLMNTHNGLFISEEEMNWFREGVVGDVFGWMGGNMSKHDIRRAIGTPVSMGGLGVYEFSDVVKNPDGFITQIVSLDDVRLIGDEKFVSLFASDAIKKIGKTSTRKVDIWKTASNFGKDLREFKSRFYSIIDTKGRVVFDSGSNIFRTILTEIASCKNYPPIVDRLLKHVSGTCSAIVKPRFLDRANRWYDIAKWMTGKTLKGVCPPSLFVDTRYDTELVSSLSGVATTMFMNLPNVTARAEYLISVFAYSRFSQTKCILHAL